MNSRERFLAALHGEPVDRPPVWLMRQAGRYLPDYRAVRERHGFWDVCHSPELSTRVALEPLQLFDVDAAIVFSDILVIPAALGLDVRFVAGEGPVLEPPLQGERGLDTWDVQGAPARLAFVPRAVSHLRGAIGADRALLGFVGAPFTLFGYVTAGGKSDDFREARVMTAAQPALARRAMATLAETAAELACRQIDAGADAIQIFDTWGGLLAREDWAAHALPHIKTITTAVRDRGGRSILFVRAGHHLLSILGESGADGISLDWRTPWREARALLPRHALQGNLDPVTLLAGPEETRRRTRDLLDEMRQDGGGRGCIVNLGHGVLPTTPAASVSAFVSEVVAASRA